MSTGTEGEKRAQRSSVRMTPDGKPLIRVSAWIRTDLVTDFRAIADKYNVEMSDVIRNAFQAFIVQDRDDSITRIGKEQKLARRVLRVLFSSLGTKEILEECLRILPAHQVDRVIAKYRGEKSK